MSEHDTHTTCQHAHDHEAGETGLRASRRDVIKGVVASGVAVSSTGYVVAGRSTEAAAQTAGAVERMVRLNVNGNDRTVDVLPQETLVQTLRYKLGLTGTKIGCDHSECGNCTVLVDGVATYSCTTLTQRVRGKKVVTIEGIAGPNGQLHKVQKAMMEELAPQCGFCTPGQIVTAVALLNQNAKPTEDEVMVALSGNLCRCGAYNHYLNAVMRASKEA